ncbi:hypothetical protein CC78DRAFT_613781 [Lojkania enalia]|uniref:FAR1 domain-containing protein n=1 Tax=Lojkania enalia TaxID=147567 RepID=A0A9P4KJ67_9PLEO|nr:hypothetical protein CC78DRAFT_613781 [Didymosphaeria enalia]
MSPALHSHNGEEDVPVYSTIPADITTPVAHFHDFSPSSHHTDPTAEHGLSTFHHRPATITHNDVSHVATTNSHMQNNGIHFEHAISSDRSPIGSQSKAPLGSNFAPQLRSQHTPAPLPMINAAPPGQFDMLPPTPSTHPSWQALHDYAQSHASAHGYALSINTTAKNRSRIKLACVCYGAPKNTHKLTPETRVRKNRVSYKTGCRMWVEGKKQDDGLWVLRVGEPNHNHPGRSMEGWAMQRKRTWGVQGGRVGMGGVTAKEEKERLGTVNNGLSNVEEKENDEQFTELPDRERNAINNLERGGLVWRIVEQEMLRKGGQGHGRDRGVGRTVKALNERLPGIQIFKRDIYNIRAQIKRARKAAGQQIGEGMNDSDREEDEIEMADRDQQHEDGHEQGAENGGGLSRRNYPEIDPILVAQCNDALKTVTQQEETELERLRREVQELRQALEQRTREIEEKTSENESLRVQVELANMALYNERNGHAH